jgi:hypothetical protein
MCPLQVAGAVGVKEVPDLVEGGVERCGVLPGRDVGRHLARGRPERHGHAGHRLAQEDPGGGEYRVLTGLDAGKQRSGGGPVAVDTVAGVRPHRVVRSARPERVAEARVADVATGADEHPLRRERATGQHRLEEGVGALGAQESRALVPVGALAVVGAHDVAVRGDLGIGGVIPRVDLLAGLEIRRPAQRVDDPEVGRDVTAWAGLVEQRLKVGDGGARLEGELHKAALGSGVALLETVGGGVHDGEPLGVDAGPDLEPGGVALVDDADVTVPAVVARDDLVVEVRRVAVLPQDRSSIGCRGTRDHSGGARVRRHGRHKPRDQVRDDDCGCAQRR